MMKTKALTDAIERVETWPASVHDELAALAFELDAGVHGNEYIPTTEELAGINRGLRLSVEGRFATSEQIEAVFRKFGDR